MINDFDMYVGDLCVEYSKRPYMLVDHITHNSEIIIELYQVESRNIDVSKSFINCIIITKSWWYLHILFFFMLHQFFHTSFLEEDRHVRSPWENPSIDGRIHILLFNIYMCIRYKWILAFMRSIQWSLRHNITQWHVQTNIENRIELLITVLMY